MASVEFNTTGSFRGTSPFPTTGHGTGGNVPVSNTSGNTVGTSSDTSWHPTIVYLIGLLVLEWIAFIVLSNYI